MNPKRRGVAFGVTWHRAWLTGNWEQGISCTTTATPENRVTPWEVARLGPVTRFREPQLTPRFGRKMPRVEQIVSGKGTRNAAPLRPGWCRATSLGRCGPSHRSTDERELIPTDVTPSYQTSSPALNNRSGSSWGVHAGSNRVTRKPKGP